MLSQFLITLCIIRIELRADSGFLDIISNTFSLSNRVIIIGLIEELIFVDQ